MISHRFCFRVLVAVVALLPIWLAAAPSISTQPGVVNATSATAATFNISASGTGTVRYQWRHLGVPIQGATESSCTLPAVKMADAGFYDVIVRDDTGETVSQAGRLLVSPLGGYPNTLRLDTGFAPLFETTSASVEDISISPSGEVYAGGVYSTIAGQRRYGLAKFNSALVLDPAFAPVLDGVVYAVLAQADGRVIVGGSFTSIDGVKQARIARFNADGTIDTTFTSGFGDAGIVHALALCRHGKILVGGWFSAVDGIQRPMVARLNSDGTLDATFGSTVGPDSTVNSIAVQQDGRVLIGGQFSQVHGNSRPYLARLNADGSLDTSFAVGSGFDSPVESLALQADGKVVVGGVFTSYKGTTCNRIARIDSTGTLDPSLVTGTGFDSHVRAVAVLSDGRIAVSGFFDAYNGTSQQTLSVLTSTGAVDPAFAPTVLQSGPSYAIVAQEGGRFLTGSYNWFGAAAGRSLVSYSATGTIEHAAATGFRTLGEVLAAVPVAGGKWVAGGTFSFLNGTPCGNIARLNANGSLDSAFMTGSGFDLPVNCLAVQGDGRIIAGGRFNAFNGTLRARITRLNADGSLDTNFDPTGGPNSPVESLVLQTDGRIVARGWFDAFNGTPCRQIARLNFDGSLDPSFALGSGFDYAAVALAAERDGRTVAGGYFTSFAGTPRNRIVRLKWDGSLDTTFDPGTGFDSNWVRALMSMSNGRIVAAGDFSGFNGTSRSKIARLNSDGSLDTSFDPGLGFNESVYGLAPQTDGRFVASGFFSSYNGTARNYLARIQRDGALDPAFIAYDLTSRVESTPQYTDDGRLLVAGGRANRGRVTQSGLVMLKPDVSPVAVITAQPLSQKANPGDSVTFSVTASGDDLHYQWSKDGVVLAGATKRTLSIPSAGTGNVGSYSVRVWNNYSTVTSDAVTLSGLALAPSITTQPGVVTAVSGTNATFMVGATGTGPLTYQWRHLGLPIAGATSASLTLPAVAMVDAGFYDVVAYSGLTPATSQPGRLMVSPAGGYPNTLRLDTSFAPVFEYPGWVYAAVPVAGGKWVVAGEFQAVNGVPCSNIARLNADGSLDPAFTTGSGFDQSVRSLAVQGDGRIVAGGWFYAFNGTPRSHIARLNADGSLDTTFDPGSGFNGRVDSVILQVDGRIVAQGIFASFNAPPRTRIARLNVDGSLDTTFDAGSGFNSYVMALAVDDYGQLVAGGYFSSCADTARNCIVRLRMDGGLDTAFEPGTGVEWNSVQALMPTTEGRIVVGGWFSGFNGTGRNNTARLNTDGSLDTAFDPGAGFNGSVCGLASQTDGWFVASGSFTSFNGIARNYLARLQPDGALDPSFAAYDLTSGTQSGAQFLDDGRLLVLGANAKRGNSTQSGLVMLKLDVSPAPAITAQPVNQKANVLDSVTFSVSASGEDLLYQWSKDGAALPGANNRTLNIPSAGIGDLGSYSVRVWNNYATVTSEVVTLSGLALAPTITTQPGVVTAVSGTNSTFTVGATGTGPFSYQWRHLGIPITGATSASLTLPTVAMADAGFYDVIVYNGLTPATSQPGRLIVSPAGGYPNTLRLDTSFAPVFGQPGIVFAAVPVAGGKWVVAGEFQTVNGVPCGNIARLNADGSLDPGFTAGSGFDRSVYSLAVQGDGRIVASGFYAFNGTPRSPIARLNADGSLDATFDPGSGFNGMVFSMILQADGRIVAQGMFDSFNGTSRTQIARLNLDGSLDATFDPGSGFNDHVMALAVDDDGRIVAGGNFSSFAGTSRNRIARLKTNGGLDTTFDPGTGFGWNSVQALMPTTEGRIVVGGWFSSFNGASRNNIARLNADGALDTTFSPGTGFNGPVMGITPQTDGGLVASGYFTSYNGAARSYLARLQSDGSLDPSFIAYDLTSAVQAGAQFTDDGRLLLLGTSATRGGTSQTGLVMLKADIDPTPMFSSWIAAQTDVPANQRGALDTPAGDGVNNLLKYAFGVLPMESAQAHLPTLAVVYGPAGNATVVLRFVRSPNVRGIRLTLEVSSDLIEWNEVPATLTVMDTLPGGSELVQLQEINAPADASRRFARLRVMVTP